MNTRAPLIPTILFLSLVGCTSSATSETTREVLMFSLSFEGEYNGEPFSQTCTLAEQVGVGQATVDCKLHEFRCLTETADGTEIKLHINTNLYGEAGDVFDESMCEQGCSTGVTINVDDYPYSPWSVGSTSISPVNTIVVIESEWDKSVRAEFVASFEPSSSSTLETLSVQGEFELVCGEETELETPAL